MDWKYYIYADQKVLICIQRTIDEGILLEKVN